MRKGTQEYVPQFSEVMDVAKKYDNNAGECRNCRIISDLKYGICAECRVAQRKLIGRKKADYSIYNKWRLNKTIDNLFGMIFFVSMNRLINPIWYFGVSLMLFVSAFTGWPWSDSFDFCLTWSMVFFLLAIVFFVIRVVIPRMIFNKKNSTMVSCDVNGVWECPSCKHINIGVHMCPNCGVFPNIVNKKISNQDSKTKM